MRYLLPILLLAFLASCQLSPCGFNKSSFLSKHEYLVDEAKEHRKKWSEEDWKKSDDKMKNLVEECYESFEEELTNQETSRFWTRTASYYVTRFGKGFIRRLGDQSELSETLKKGFDSIKRNPDGLLKDLLNEAGGEDLKDALNELGDELKNIGEEIDSWLNE